MLLHAKQTQTMSITVLCLLPEHLAIMHVTRTARSCQAR